MRGVVDLDRYRMRCIRSRYNNPIHISFLQRLGSKAVSHMLLQWVLGHFLLLLGPVQLALAYLAQNWWGLWTVFVLSLDYFPRMR